MEAKDSFWLKDWENEPVSFSIKIARIKNRIESILYSIKVFFQRIFDKDHLSPNDIWNLSHSLAPKILTYLTRFKKMERHGYPGYFSEYNENEWKSKEEYEEAVAKGNFDPDVAAGTITGPEKWEQILDKMIFAFEWLVKIDGGGMFNDKITIPFYKKWGLKDPHAKVKENERIDYVYEMTPEYIKEQEEKNDIVMKFGGLSSEMMSSEGDLHIKNPEKYKLLGSKVIYYNIEYEIEVIEKRVQEGLDLFSKFYRSLWD